MPKLPSGRKSDAEVILNQNKLIIQTCPWTRALVENIYIADLNIKKVKLENKNRFALLLLDTCLEVALKDYLFRVEKVGATKEKHMEFTHRESFSGVEV